jgi:hypothetical protein
VPSITTISTSSHVVGVNVRSRCRREAVPPKCDEAAEDEHL